MATTTVSGEPFLEMLQGSGGGPGPGGAADVVVIDVREPHELAGGRLQDSFAALGVTARYGEVALGDIVEGRALEMDDEAFSNTYGFEKPKSKDTVVFTCAAGVRSNVACQVAGQQGFNDTVNYGGGWTEWVSMFHRH